MQLDLTLTDDDRGITYECTVYARVVEEIGGPRGHCCDIDLVRVSKVIVKLGGKDHELVITHDFWFVGNEVEELFKDQIKAECIEHFEELRHRQAG